MPRRRESSPYQLPLDFERAAAEAAVYRAVLQGLSTEPAANRFVRTVRETVLVHSPADAAAHLMRQVFAPFEQLDQEELWVLLLSSRNQVTHEVMLYRGTLDSVPVRPAEVFKEAIRINAAAIVLAHNHPSGEPTPSAQDIKLTETVVGLGAILGIQLLDHIVVGRGAWLSLAEQGLGFSQR